VETSVPFKADQDCIEILVTASPPGASDAKFTMAEVQFKVEDAVDGELNISSTHVTHREGMDQHNFGLGIKGIRRDVRNLAEDQDHAVSISQNQRTVGIQHRRTRESFPTITRKPPSATNGTPGCSSETS
jgi:hypothetical protein